jgi:hypothetical protein
VHELTPEARNGYRWPTRPGGAGGVIRIVKSLISEGNWYLVIRMLAIQSAKAKDPPGWRQGRRQQ